MMTRRQPRYSKGDRISGRYFVHQALMGGMGEVYLCLDERDYVPYALKTFQGSSPALADFFKGEVANWIALEKHPNIVRCFWMEYLDNIPFMALEWVAGEEGKGTDLRSWLRRGPLDLPLALRFTIDIVRGLIHANEKFPGIVHRDLKPDNVLVNQTRQAKITDFGLATVAQIAARDVDATDEPDMGQSRYIGNIVGTPAYMPPEQWRGEADIDFRADVYAVGCILYELLTGRWLYDCRTVSELRAKHLEAPIPALNNGFPSGLKPILDGCLAKRRENRFSQLDLLLAELTNVYEAHSDEPLPKVTGEAFTADDYNNRGITFANLGQDSHAIRDFDRAIELDPKTAIAYSNRGTNYGNWGQHERAVADLDEAIRLDPNLALAYLNRGRIYANIGDHARAIHDYNRAIDLDPNVAKAHSNRGHSYGVLGQNQRAIADFNRAIQLDPTFAGAYYNRAVHYAALGQHERALEDFDVAIRLDPSDPDFYYNRGISCGALGQHNQAIQNYDVAIQLDPNYKSAYLNRGNRYGALGQHNHAIENYDVAIRLDPNYEAAYLNRGATYAALGEHHQAIENYDIAIHLNPNRAEAHFNKGIELENNGNFQEALHCYQSAYALGIQKAAGAIQHMQRLLGLSPTEPHRIEREHVILQLTNLYQEYGESGLRQLLAQQGIPSAEIENIVGIIVQRVQAEAVQQLIELYQQQGEMGLRQLLQQQGASAAQVDRIFAMLKRTLGE